MKTQLGLLLSQFHQDWNLDYSSWEELVDSWSARRSNPAKRDEAVQELNWMLAQDFSESELEDRVVGLGCDLDRTRWMVDTVRGYRRSEAG